MRSFICNVQTFATKQVKIPFTSTHFTLNHRNIIQTMTPFGRQEEGVYPIGAASLNTCYTDLAARK